MSAPTTSWGSADAILDEAGVAEVPGYYCDFTGEDEKAVLTVPMRIQTAWARNDADMFADLFTDNGSLLMQDNQLTSRADIHAYMSAGFSGPLAGAKVKGWPISITFLTDKVAMIITEGGIIMAGEDSIAPERKIRATWIVTRESGRLQLVSHQSSPIAG
jgi:uncharacterized protein (TIGR02246 family)